MVKAKGLPVTMSLYYNKERTQFSQFSDWAKITPHKSQSI